MKKTQSSKMKRVVIQGALLLLVVFLLYWGWIFARVVWWNYVNPSETAFMSERLDIMRKTRPQATLKYRWVDYENISISLKRAVVAAEDDRFVDHGGFDWENIGRALEKNLNQGRAVSGGSTISQQLAKNLFLSSEKSMTRKAREAIITVMIETVWSKKRILEVYLNVAEWGDGVFGAEAAANRYYGISASRLNADQAVRLAVMLPNPRRYERQYPPALARHADSVKARMGRSHVP
ncbi:MAG: monofunctional biosynthetic peptidoglycan transglycosylase [Burkholderiales bacterium]|jgi:monofunctional biosynthetic peptidoglycan transglycosylase|nr:monofunctional biosynthetic peptidoglycan transglycosylase [Burkholderiales bacterium]